MATKALTSAQWDVVEKVHEIIDSPVHEDAQGSTIYYSEDGSEAMILVDMGSQGQLLYNVYQDGQFVFATQARSLGEFEEV